MDDLWRWDGTSWTDLLLGPAGPSPGARVEAAFFWDGLAQGGDLQPPGLYLYRLIIDIEPDAVVTTGVVGIAY